MEKIQEILEKAVCEIQKTPGICAIVLGGSRARGNPRPDSDIDIGIYYDAALLDIAALDDAASKVDEEGRKNIIAPPGEWGNWVNGGGWLVVEGYHVDFILRDIARVAAVVEDCEAGRITAHYQTGHPHAYLNCMYAGELAIAKVLWQEEGCIAQIKARAEAYPQEMRAALLHFFLFEAGFSAMFARDNAGRGDMYYVMAHIIRSVSALNQVLFALNREYCLNEKKAVGMIESFALRPEKYADKIENILSADARDLSRNCAALDALLAEVEGLV